MCEFVCIALLQGWDFSRDSIKQLAVFDDAILDGFLQTGAHFARWQRAQCFRVYDDERWLMKGADEIFSERVIYARLAARPTGIPATATRNLQTLVEAVR